MTEAEKMEAGLEYRFTDRELGGPTLHNPK